MGGKSTHLRQTALLCLLAQAGAFVPARSAKLPIIDRIFARVGASDNLARGQSTFMVEMQETANSLHRASDHSLVILDEVGRGTATFDGLSLAWAVAEHLATNTRARPKTIFATHFHELTDLADTLPGVSNLHVVVREWRDDIVFLRKVVPGRSDRSYGIQSRVWLWPDKPDPEKILQVIEKYQPTFFFSVPTLFARFLRIETKYDLSSLRICLSSGEPLPPSLFYHWKVRTGMDVARRRRLHRSDP